MRLLLVRHAQTPANVAGVLAAAVPGPGLTELGRAQAEELPRALSGESIDRIYVSTMLRTTLTAAPLARERDLSPAEFDGIREISAGDLEGRSDRESILAYVETVWAWTTGDLDRRMPGGERGTEFLERFDAVIERIAADAGDGASVAVSHGAAIRCWCALRARNAAPSGPGDYQLDNTGVVALEGAPGTGWTLRSWTGRPVGGLTPGSSDPSAGSSPTSISAPAR